MLFPDDFAIKWGLGIDNTLGEQLKADHRDGSAIHLK